MAKKSRFCKSTLNVWILLVKPRRTKRKADSDSLIHLYFDPCLVGHRPLSGCLPQRGDSWLQVGPKKAKNRWFKSINPDLERSGKSSFLIGSVSKELTYITECWSRNSRTAKGPSLQHFTSQPATQLTVLYLRFIQQPATSLPFSAKSRASNQTSLAGRYVPWLLCESYMCELQRPPPDSS